MSALWTLSPLPVVQGQPPHVWTIAFDPRSMLASGGLRKVRLLGPDRGSAAPTFDSSSILLAALARAARHLGEAGRGKMVLSAKIRDGFKLADRLAFSAMKRGRR